MIDYLRYRNTIWYFAVESFVMKELSLLQSEKIGEIFKYMFGNMMESYSYRENTGNHLSYFIVPSLIRYWRDDQWKFWKLLLNHHSSLKLQTNTINNFFTSYLMKVKSKSREELDEVSMKFLKAADYCGLGSLSTPLQIYFTRKVLPILKKENRSFLKLTNRHFKCEGVCSPDLNEHLESLSHDRVLLNDFFQEDFIFAGGLLSCYIFRNYDIDLSGKSSKGINWLLNAIEHFPKIDIASFFKTISFKSLKMDWELIDPDMKLFNQFILEEDVSTRLSMILGFSNKNVIFTDQLLSEIIDSSNYAKSCNEKALIIRNTVEHMLPLVVFQQSRESFQQFYDNNITLVKGNNCNESDLRLKLCFKVWKIIG